VSGRSDPLADDLWVVEVSSKETRKLTAGVDVMSTPAWSPDGSHIAFNGMQSAEFWYGDQSDVYLVQVAEGELIRLPMNTFVSDRNGGISMAWHPDSRHLFFRYEWEGDANLWTVGIEDGVATKLTYEEGSFGNFSVSSDGRSIAYVRSTPVRSGEIHRFDLGGGPPVQLTEWTLRYQGLVAPEKITFPSRDQKYILGYLSLPPDFDPSRRYPALVQVHGGGNNAHGNGFHALEHLLSHEGFVVLAIEYRGSAGHGRDFQDLSLGEWAAGQGWDAVAAAEYLRSLPYSNGKVGIYGGSYGGIMSLAALTRDSGPFDAAAPLYGIYDWADAYDHADRLMKFWVIEGHFGFKPGENPDLFEHTASIRHLDRVKTDLPFLVMHGELDRRAPFQQSVRLVEALRVRGNPVEFRTYPDEGHGFRRRDNRIDAYGRLIEFFKEHLTAGSGSSQGETQ
jgi:dipeptidyl aminopeptidase/acylaminoacyl peptidase